jgi:penicillin amidase
VRDRNRWTLRGEAPIEIARDSNGVPHVRAQTEADAYRGLGSCHATDRALQVLLIRVIGRGRASELLAGSDEMLRSDLVFRRLNLGGDAEAEVERLSPPDRVLVQAYCDGINEVLSRRIPGELRLLTRVRFEPWTIADTILVSRLAGYVSLAQSQGELERLLAELVQAGLPLRHLEALFPGALRDLDLDLLRSVRLGDRLVPETIRWATAVPHAVGSNNWVISGSRTASGAALLANDPHLEVNRLPAVWYEAAVDLGDRWWAGATMPGLPSMLIGRSDRLALGATYAFMDAIDSWVEECRDGRFRRVLDGEERWLPFDRRQETILRRGGDPVEVRFHENDHGVLDGDPEVPGRYLTTRWSSGSGTGAASLAASFAILRAGTVEEAMSVVGRIETAFNWVIAGPGGRIGYQMSGRMPVRREGANGLVPLPGWDPRNDWAGTVPAEDLPRALDPPEEFIATANEDRNHLGRAAPINAPMAGYRAERIAAILAERSNWTVADSQALQMDTYSTQAERLLEVLSPLLADGPAAETLRSWDRRYEPESVGASLFEELYGELVDGVFGAVLGAEAFRHLRSETGILADFYLNLDRVLLDPDSPWFEQEGRDAVLARAAERALAKPAAPWGERQRFVMRHLLLGGRLPRALGFDRGPLSLRGGRGSVHQGQIYRAAGRETSFAPSYRLITDLAERAVHTALAGGPSDRRRSRWYASGVADWLAGRLKTIRPAG